jgi:hypothetical protein
MSSSPDSSSLTVSGTGWVTVTRSGVDGVDGGFDSTVPP